jgi:hypothetical protein
MLPNMKTYIIRYPGTQASFAKIEAHGLIVGTNTAGLTNADGSFKAVFPLEQIAAIIEVDAKEQAGFLQKYGFPA